MRRSLLGFVLITTPLLAQAADLDAVREYLERTYSTDGPGASVVLMQRGKILHAQGYGMANLELNVPVESDTVFRVGSITKQITAAAIMLLQEDGALAVTDPIDKYLPDYPTHGHMITIEHLLTHTSGIRSYTGIPGYMGNPVRRDLSIEELVGVFDQLPMEFAPGTQWRYNNSGYVLLGAIIEAVSGKTYAQFVEERITGPLGLTDTYYGGPRLIMNRASGYTMDAGGNIRNADPISMTQPHAAGALLSTAPDLANWHNALVHGELISRDSFAQMSTPYELSDGKTHPYGYGLGLGEVEGREMIAHGGGIHGFSCFALWLPDSDTYVAVLTNTVNKPASGALVMYRLVPFRT